jgi:hypothetical protein
METSASTPPIDTTHPYGATKTVDIDPGLSAATKCEIRVDKHWPCSFNIQNDTNPARKPPSCTVPRLYHAPMAMANRRASPGYASP